MRRSLFETYTVQPTQRPRIRPNIYARIAQFSYAHGWLVLVFWMALSSGFLSLAILRATQTPQTHLQFNAASEVQKNLTTLNENFPNLDALVALSIINSDPVKLKQDRDNLIAKLSENQKDFDFVFSPGTGTYYDTHSILYHPIDEVKARVAYALSLRPLFTALAAAPTTESLSTLVNEVSASIELGRDPQGLDALFSESAAAVQALIKGEDRQVDWRKIAGLDVESRPNSALIFIMPKREPQNVASTEINRVVDAMPKSEGTTTIIDQPNIAVAKLPVSTSKQMIPGLIMMAILVFFAFLILLNDFALSMMIALPSLTVVALLSGLSAFSMPDKVVTLWPLFVATGIVATQASTRFSFAMVDVLQLGRGAESAVMLAAQRFGGELILLGLCSVAVWAGSFLLQDFYLVRIAILMIAASVLSAVVTLTLVPAIAGIFPNTPRWHAEEWIVSAVDLLFNNPIWNLLRRLLPLLALAGAVFGFWFATNALPRVSAQEDQAAVNLVAHSGKEAELIIAKLKSVPQAQAARWLGAFLPQQSDEKRQELQKLKESFQKITPLIPTATDLLREQIDTLQASLSAIANSPATRPELSQSAQEFRRSLVLLASTSSDHEIRALENRIFGSFNVLSDQADLLANLDSPNLETLDPKLSQFFLSPSEVYRIEVLPAQGITNVTLAQKLVELKFPVAHPAAVFAENFKLQKNYFTILLVALAGIICGALAVVTRNFIAVIATIVSVLTGGGMLLAFAIIEKPSTDIITLLSLASLANFLIYALAGGHLKASAQASTHSTALQNIEAWLPTGLLGALLIPSLLLNIEPPTSRLMWLTLSVICLTCISRFVFRPMAQFLDGSGAA
jgi:uncharacterized protein